MQKHISELMVALGQHDDSHALIERVYLDKHLIGVELRQLLVSGQSHEQSGRRDLHIAETTKLVRLQRKTEIRIIYRPLVKREI